MRKSLLAYVEMRFVEEASNAMALDGIIFEGTQVIKVRRPTGYNPSLAATLGPSQPNPNLNLAAAGVLYPGSTGDGLEGRDYIFVGGLPYYFSLKLRLGSCWSPLVLFGSLILSKIKKLETREAMRHFVSF
ncbi:hypothetical protein P3L10_019499 [Capsicum annuum]